MARAISVNQLNQYIKRILERDPILEDLTVKGEISNLKYHSSGHVYFTLKDSVSKVNCFLPKENLKNINTVLDDGIEIICVGKISVMDKGGYYSLYIKHIEIQGVGQLSAAFEKLKEKLLKEGLFDRDNKKPIPVFPKKIGIITSGEGAAVRDIIKIITSKNTYTDILVIPCLVQGPLAPSDIAAKIELANTLDDLDVLIVGRGGGSLEELWAFNEEIVARSIFNSRIPIISAVGHETDVTISDFVADLRAETPTAAANIAAPDTYMLTDKLTELRYSMIKSLKHKNRIKEEKLDYMLELMKIQIKNIMDILMQKLENSKVTIEAFNPDSILKKGYTISLNEKGKTIRSVNDINIMETFKTIIIDGTFTSEIKDIVQKK